MREGRLITPSYRFDLYEGLYSEMGAKTINLFVSPSSTELKATRYCRSAAGHENIAARIIGLVAPVE